MPRGVLAIAETQAEAERQVVGDAVELRVLRSRKIDLTGVPALPGMSYPTHWVVVIEQVDPEDEAKLPQQIDPEAEVERELRTMYLRMVIDPDLVVAAVLEEFVCPLCNEDVQVELPPPHESKDVEYVACPACQAHLTRPRGALAWAAKTRRPKPPSCFYCPAAADTYEHLVPEWISKQLGVRDFLSAKDAVVLGSIARRKQPISLASHRARILCEGCNKHFGRLEERVIPLLVPMGRGFVLSLDMESQALLALWAAKTAGTLMAETPEQWDSIPMAYRQAVRAGRVPRDVWVGFFPWTGGPLISTAQGVVGGPTGTRETYSTIFAFAKVGFAVVGFVEPVGSNEVVDDGGHRLPVRQFWPPQARLVHWSAPPAAGNRMLPMPLNLVPLRAA